MQSVYDDIFVGSYNLFYTSLPVIIMATLDQDLGPALAARYPALYHPGLAKLWFSRKVFSNFAIHGLVTSLILTGTCLGKSACHSHSTSPHALLLLLLMIL